MICPHCKLNNLMKEGKKRICLSCGREVKNATEKHKFIELNEEEIVQDYLVRGCSETTRKWGISTSTLYRLEGIREIMGQRHLANMDNHRHLPQMPEFSNEWTSDVQMKWLEIYSVLLDKEAKNG